MRHIDKCITEAIASRKTGKYGNGPYKLEMNMPFSDFEEWLKTHGVKKIEIEFTSFDDLREKNNREKLVGSESCVIIYDYDSPRNHDTTVCYLYPSDKKRLFSFSFYKDKLLFAHEEYMVNGKFIQDHNNMNALTIDKVNSIYK